MFSSFYCYHFAIICTRAKKCIVVEFFKHFTIVVRIMLIFILLRGYYIFVYRVWSVFGHNSMHQQY